MRCPHCDGTISEADKYCRHCGRQVTTQPRPTRPGSSILSELGRTSSHLESSKGKTWGARINPTYLGPGWPRSLPYGCPEWVDRRDWEYWDRHGLVVWDNEAQRIGALRAGEAVALLEQLQSSMDWQTAGIPIGEHGTILALDETRRPKRARKKKGAPPGAVPEPPKSEPKDFYEERLRLKGQAAEEFFAFLRAHEDQLREIAGEVQKRINDAVLKYWGALFQDHFTEEMSQMDLTGRPLPWVRQAEPPALVCALPPDRGKVTVDESGLWWQPTLEAADSFPYHGPPFAELVKALEWVEQELPQRRIMAEERDRASAEAEAEEEAWFAALPKKDLEPFWIDPAALEPDRITYRAFLQVEYAPYSCKKFELSPGKFVDYDEEWYAPAMLTKELQLDMARVEVEQPIDILGLYFIQTTTTYLQADVAAAQAERLWETSAILEKFKENKVIRARYGYIEAETRYRTWLGMCAGPDNPWGAAQTRADYMAEQALHETLVAALDINGWRALFRLKLDERSDEQILHDLHKRRAKSRHQPVQVRAESERWLKDHAPELRSSGQPD